MQAMVIASYGDAVDVVREDGRTVRCRLPGRLRFAQARLIAGDRVRLGADGASVYEVLPRTSALRRKPTPRTEHRIREDLTVAVNLNLCLVVQACRDPQFRSAVADRLIAVADRLIAVVRASAIAPVLVLTKAEDVPAATLRSILDPYADMGVPGLITSAVTGLGLSDLARCCTGRTVALLGPSGVGKSALTGALTGVEPPAVGTVSDARRRRGRGRHTTVGAHAYPLPGGGWIIDTAGIRGLGLPDGTDPLDAFPEIAELAEHCRFRDCRHGSEPGCAVRAALAEGRLAPAAWQGFRALQDH